MTLARFDVPDARTGRRRVHTRLGPCAAIGGEGAPAFALAAILLTAGCATQKASIAFSPASADVAASTLAEEAARRESPAAGCFPGAVVPDLIARMSIEAPSAPPPRAIAARQVGALLASGDLAPVYCRNVEPDGVQAAKPPVEKMADAARWWRASAIAADPGQVAVSLRAAGRTVHRQVDVFDTGERRNVVLDRHGAEVVSATVPRGGRRVTIPVQSSIVTPMPVERAVDVRGEMREAIAVVPVSRETAAAIRTSCAVIVGDTRAVEAGLPVVLGGPGATRIAGHLLARHYAGPDATTALGRYRAMPAHVKRALRDAGAPELDPDTAARMGRYRVSYEEARTCRTYYPAHARLDVPVPATVSLVQGDSP